jgi:peptidoglycan/xylan/chitin deacetylase (PgdA/CDA1 family)
VESRADAYLERNFHTIDQFRTHLRILRRHRIVAPAEVLDREARPAGLRVAITFDDGYKNNEIAAELLDEAGMPWALYVATGEIGSERTIWTALIGLLLLQGRASAVEVLDQRWPLHDRDQRLASFGAIRRVAKELPQAERLQLLDDLLEQFDPGEADSLLDAFPSFKMLSWDDLRSLSSHDVTIGSHGVVHEIHNPAQTEAVLRQELEQSRAAIHERLGRDCTTFAFPNGDEAEPSRRLASEAGYQTAFTTEDGTVGADSAGLALPRLTAIGDTVSFTRVLLSGSAVGRA